KHIENWIEDAGYIKVEVARRDKIDCCARFSIVVIVPVRVVPASCFVNLGGGQAEEKHVVLARFPCHFDGGSITRSNGDSSVHHKLHVARPACFIPCSRNLF